MPPRKQRNRDQQPELLRLVDQQSEQSAGEQRPSLDQALAVVFQEVVHAAAEQRD
jgi:hypothetical protein